VGNRKMKVVTCPDCNKSREVQDYSKAERCLSCSRRKAMTGKPSPKKKYAGSKQERHIEAVRQYRLRNPGRVKDSRQSQYLARKRRAMEILGGCKCCNCGCDELSFLEINHINGGCVEFRERGNRIVDDLLANKRTSEGLNVLCRVCNALDHLARKNPEAAAAFTVGWDCDVIVKRWENLTGEKAVCQSAIPE
jgi:hypothetical protein